MVKLGKITFRELLDSDLNKLQIFCDECKSLGYNNNASFDSIKLAKMKMPYGKYFIGIDDSKDKIFNLAGVHHLPEVSNNAWRCLFRGAQVPGYNLSKGLTKNIFLTGYQLSYILPLQINFIRKLWRHSGSSIYIFRTKLRFKSNRSIYRGIYPKVKHRRSECAD